MLLLLFRTGKNLYAFDAKRVVEVVPRVDLRAVPHAPAYLAGLLSYRGQAVPVIDFGVLVGESPSRDALNTRVILTRFTAHDGRTPLVGVTTENVSHVRHAEGRQVITPSMSLDEAPYLGAVVQLDEGLVQIVAVDMLFSRRLQDALYGASTGPG